jgi:CBS domain-containing protein
MRAHGIRHLPVMRAGALVGVLMDRRVREASGPAMDEERAAQLTVEERAVMDVYVVDLETRLDDVVLTMAARHVDCALVTRDGRLAGLFTASDACRVFGEYLRRIDPPPPADDIA